MTLILYAIADRGHVIPAGTTGLGGSSLRSISAGELVAIVSAGKASAEATPDALLEFEHTVEMLMEERTVLPARFGTELDDEDAALDLLSTRHRQFADALRRVGGAVEMGVRAGWPDASGGDHPSGETAGADYLLGRLAQQQRAQRVAAELDAALAGLARQGNCRILARSQGQVTAAYLVARPRIDEFLATCQKLADTVTEASVVCTGPWPPYSFVGAEET
jgi:hypothetical protein